MAMVGQDVRQARRRAAVLGHPVRHSLSPVLHRAAYDRLELEGWAYGLQDVTAEQLPDAVAGLDASWAGLSLTMPLKQAVLPLLDVVDPLAEVTGAVNTLVVQPGRAGTAGPLVGFNTDVAGIVAALRETARAAGHVDWRPRSAAVLGARATASSTLAALGELGLASTTLIARNVSGPGNALLAAHRMGVAAAHRAWSSPEAGADALLRAGAPDVVVSTVPAGAADELAAALADRLDGAALAGSVLLDVVYDPWPTPLARVWESAGGTVAPGWVMLLHQAVAQVQLFTGRKPDVEVMRAALVAELAARAAGAEVPDSPPVLSVTSSRA
ncbi:shikimate dehydrogenase [Georgenia halophila]|uniref:Shikimate dehydrogenase n=1 Tax=Georgenia halophila TaxID=620889 RepID=A0ABP8L8T0_9MICO